MTGSADRLQDEVLARLAVLRQHQRDGRRSPHKPLLALLALGRLATTGSSAVTWQVAQVELAGRFVPSVERVLAADHALIASAARALVEAHFPTSIAPDVLAAVGLDSDAVLHAPERLPQPAGAGGRRRDPTWRESVIQAWDRQCAFCGFDGQIYGASVGIDAAHVRWFAIDGPDSLDNGLALCALHHRLFDHGVLGLDDGMRVRVSGTYSSRTPSGQAVYDLSGNRLRVRPGTPLPAARHVAWHRQQVFKGEPLAA